MNMESQVKDRTDVIVSIITELKIENESVKSENRSLHKIIADMEDKIGALKKRIEEWEIEYNTLKDLYESTERLCYKMCMDDLK